MDNDNALIKKIKKRIKDIKFKLNYSDINILSPKLGNDLIFSTLSRDGASMVARCGATEMRCVDEFLRLDSKRFFSRRIKKEINELSGVFPPTDEILKRFCEEYIQCVKQADILSLWGVGAESKIIHKYCLHAKFINLRALEPYYYGLPWSRALAGRNVLIIHPFSESIKSQYRKREHLFKSKNVLPQFKELKCIQAVQSAAKEFVDFSSWFEALDFMKNEISTINFDVAIIGAGAYSLPLAAYVKSLGKNAVQLSGATQILFGIKGRRWDKHPYISKLYNEYWVRPLETEKPKEYQSVEGGSYW